MEIVSSRTRGEENKPGYPPWVLKLPNTQTRSVVGGSYTELPVVKNNIDRVKS